MSGWTCITVEPQSTTEKKMPTADEVEELREIAMKSRDDANAGDNEQCVSGLEELQEKLETLLEKTGEVDGEEKVWEYLEENWGQDCVSSYGVIDWHSTPTFQHEVRGLGYGNGGKETVKKIFDECDYAKRVLVVCANDTSDSGDGWLWKRDPNRNGKIMLVAEKNGYEGCVGRDVTGYFREEYNISGLACPH